MSWDTSTIFSRLDSADRSLAWKKLNDRFRSPIINIAKRMGLPLEEAEDAAQDTLIAFFASLTDGHYDPSKGRASTWLFGIAIRQILNSRRKWTIDVARFQFGQNSSFWGKTPATEVETAHWMREWKREIVHDYLEQVRSEVEPITFHAFELVARAGKTPQETATTLGVTIKTVYNAKHRILKRVREIREEHEKTIFESVVCFASTEKN